MLDLNVVAASFSVEYSTSGEETHHRKAAAGDGDSVTSTTTSTTNNAAADDRDDSNSSNRRKMSLSTLNFSILNRNVIEIEDDVDNNEAVDKNELQLFPLGVAESAASSSSSPAASRAKFWLNLSVPEVTEVGGGGVEMGIYKAQLPATQLQQPPVKKSRRGPRSRSSQYRGVTFYRRTGRWESHIWDCGKQVYLGGFDTAHVAARAYDRAAIKFRGVDADINFNISDYEEDMKQMKNLTKDEFIHVLRRHSNGFSRGRSKYRGVTLHKCGRWEARMGQFLGKKAYDKAVIKCNGREAVTNFEPSIYEREINNSSRQGGSGSSLDLNLGISLASHCQQGNNTTRNLQLPYASCELDGKIVKAETASAVPHGLEMATKSTPMWTGVYNGFAPSNKEKATGMSIEAIPFPGFSNWPLKMQSHGAVNPVPLLSSAASSGFSSNTTSYSNSLLPLTPRPQFPTTAFHNLQ